jgi:hypothetical protein
MIQLTTFEKFIRPEVLLCPWPTLSYALTQTIIDFAEETWVFSKSFNVTAATADIVTAINDYIDIDAGSYVTDKTIIAVDDFLIDGVTWRLKYVDLSDDIDDDNLSSVRDTDQKMFSIRDTGALRIHELSDGQKIFLKVIFKPDTDITEIDDTIFNDYLNPIVDGTKARLLMIPNQPWTNTAMAGYYLKGYDRGASIARRKIQKGFTKEPGFVKWREFGG